MRGCATVGLALLRYHAFVNAHVQIVRDDAGTPVKGPYIVRATPGTPVIPGEFSIGRELIREFAPVKESPVTVVKDNLAKFRREKEVASETGPHAQRLAPAYLGPCTKSRWTKKTDQYKFCIRRTDQCQQCICDGHKLCCRKRKQEEPWSRLGPHGMMEHVGTNNSEDSGKSYKGWTCECMESSFRNGMKLSIMSLKLSPARDPCIQRNDSDLYYTHSITRLSQWNNFIRIPNNAREEEAAIDFGPLD